MAIPVAHALGPVIEGSLLHYPSPRSIALSAALPAPPPHQADIATGNMEVALVAQPEMNIL